MPRTIPPPRSDKVEAGRVLERIICHVSRSGGVITVDEVWKKMQESKVFVSRQWIADQSKHMRFDWR
jgi:hypothetical protein